MTAQYLEDLFDYIRFNDIEAVRNSLTNNTFAYCLNYNQYSPLSEAATRGNHEIVQLLIQYGADIHEKIHFGQKYQSKWCTLLHLMAKEKKPFNENHIKVGEILIAHGANVNAYDYVEGKCRTTSLLEAIDNGNVKWAELLLKNGAKLDGLKMTTKSSSKHVFESHESRQEMLKLLLKYGLDITARNHWNQNLLNQFCDDFVEKDDTNNIKIAEILIDAGVPVDELDLRGRTPLTYSIRKQSIPLVSFFILKGANVNKVNAKKKSPLHYAFGNLEMMELLLSHGADIQVRTKHKWSLLHGACENQCRETIKFLIEKGLPISTESKKGVTPFSLLKFDIFLGFYDECLIIMIKEFAKLEYQKLPISDVDKTLIQTNFKAQEHFKVCMVELDKMDKTKFYGSYSYLFALTSLRNVQKCNLTSNKEFVLKFEESLCKFPIYEDDLKRVLKKAKQVQSELGFINLALHSIFGDSFPGVVIRKIGQNMALKDFITK